MGRLELVNISRRYGETAVLQDVTLEVEDGEFLVLVGPSGSGKSTLLRIVAGLIEASSGDIRLDGVRVNDREPRERDVAMVFQNYALYPHMSVRGNLAFPLKMRAESRASIESKIERTARLLALDGLLDRKPAELSGGQMQRVALGRAIIREPRLFLFDEPLSNLDARLRSELRAEITRLQRELRVTTIYVTHDQAEALTMGTRIGVMHRGRVEQIGAPLEVYHRPANTFVAGFIGSPAMNLIRGRLEGGSFRAGKVSLEVSHSSADREIVLGIRPHDVHSDRGPELEVLQVEHLGSQTLAWFEVAGQPLCMAREGHQDWRPGRALEISFAPAGHCWFDAATGQRIELD